MPIMIIPLVIFLLKEKLHDIDKMIQLLVIMVAVMRKIGMMMNMMRPE